MHSVSVGITAVSDPGAATLFVMISGQERYLGIADEMQDKDSYAQYDPVHILDQAKPKWFI